MKKYLLFKIFFIAFLFFNNLDAQIMDPSGEVLIPQKKLGNISSYDKSPNMPVFGSTIILNTESDFKWTGGLKFGASNHSGNLKMLSGNLSIENDKILGSVIIDMKSLSNSDMQGSSAERLVGHLRSADFFDVEKFPKASLEIKESNIIRKLDDGKYEMIFEAILTIKNKSKIISFTAKVDLSSEIKTAIGKMKFDRNDFNIQYRSEMHLDDPKTFWNKLQTTRDTAKDKVIRDEIVIEFNVYSLPGIISQ